MPNDLKNEQDSVKALRVLLANIAVAYSFGIQALLLVYAPTMLADFINPITRGVDCS